MINEKLLHKFLQQLEKIQYGTLEVVTPSGAHYTFQGKISTEPKATFIMQDFTVMANLLAKGDVGFAESYRDGHFETDTITNLLVLALKNFDTLGTYVYGSFFFNIFARILYYLRANTVKGSKRNIHTHYDLGNRFYAMWLDPTMTYSSALFNSDRQSLQDAQNNKYDRIIQSLERDSGTVLEVGCGWGGFITRALNIGDYAIKGINLSQQQYDFARNRLGGTAQVALEDYRKQTRKYDTIVSIEMFEAVGEKYWSTYFNKVRSLLHNKGKAVMQVITIEDSLFERYRKIGDMIRSFIFPGGMLPSFSRFKEEVAKSGLQVTGSFAFGSDYVKTLQHWLLSFEKNIHTIKGLGFDEEFTRIWRFYLAACIAGFSVKRTNVRQIEICHA